MGPLQQGSKEARSMSELKDRLESLLEALFMRILDSPSHATFGTLGAFAMRSMWAWAGFQFCQASSFLSIYVCKFFANVATGESQAATQNHYLGELGIRDQKFTTI